MKFDRQSAKSFAIVAFGAALSVSGVGCSWMQTALRMRDGLGRSLADRGMAARAEGDNDEAVRLLSQAAERDPDQIDIHRELACLHDESGNGNACVQHLRRVAELESDNAESWAKLAEALHEHGDSRRAGDAADRSLELDPTNTQAMLVLAKLLEEGGRPLDALEAHHRVLDADPSNVDSRLAVARIHLDLGNADRAAPVLRSLCACPLTDDSEKCEAWWSLGIAYGRIGRWTDAVRALETGTESHDTADDWYRLAFARRAAGDVDGVREALREIQRREPSHNGGVSWPACSRRTTPAFARSGAKGAGSPCREAGSRCFCSERSPRRSRRLLVRADPRRLLDGDVLPLELE